LFQKGEIFFKNSKIGWGSFKNLLRNHCMGQKSSKSTIQKVPKMAHVENR
jgi:hypothetical protein